MEENLRRFRNRVGTVLEWILFGIFVFLLVIVTIQIISRFFPLPLLDNQMFSGELTGYLLVYLTFLGASYATFRNEHMAISYFFEKFSITSQIFIKHLSNIIYLGVGIFLAAVSIKSASFSFMLGTMCDTIPVPVGVIYLAFPIAFILMTIFVLLQTVLTIINPRGVLEEENKGCFE